MDRDGFEFDLVTQRFLVNRWETEIGKLVHKRVIKGIKNGVDIRSILDPYVLEHSENQDPYGYPYYPKEVMDEGRFWVLTQDDLCGIKIYHEDFNDNRSLVKKSLNYARFNNCSFINANFEQSSLTSAYFKKCNLENSCFAGGGGYGIVFSDCNLRSVCFWQSSLSDANFSGSDLTGAYFEDAHLDKISVNYLSKFDTELSGSWSKRNMPEREKPEILKAIRIAYEQAELWPLADKYVFLERKKYRKTILWSLIEKKVFLSSFWDWFVDWVWGVSTGYGVRPIRIFGLGVFVALVFTLIFYIAGNPGAEKSFVTSIYYSLTTFATLGYGDLHYLESRWIMRLIVQPFHPN